MELCQISLPVKNPGESRLLTEDQESPSHNNHPTKSLNVELQPCLVHRISRLMICQTRGSHESQKDSDIPCLAT